MGLELSHVKVKWQFEKCFKCFYFGNFSGGEPPNRLFPAGIPYYPTTPVPPLLVLAGWEIPGPILNKIVYIMNIPSNKSVLPVLAKLTTYQTSRLLLRVAISSLNRVYALRSAKLWPVLNRREVKNWPLNRIKWSWWGHCCVWWSRRSLPAISAHRSPGSW